MGEGQPVAQLLHGLFRCAAVEWHQCCRTTGSTDQVSTPAVRIDQHGFDLVRAAVDGFFDAVDGHKSAVGAAELTRRRCGF